jgi:hypothetical protein
MCPWQRDWDRPVRRVLSRQEGRVAVARTHRIDERGGAGATRAPRTIRHVLLTIGRSCVRGYEIRSGWLWAILIGREVWENESLFARTAIL